MQKLLQLNERIKSSNDHLQTEEEITDSRSGLTPSQRVDAKLAACSAAVTNRYQRSGSERFTRRPK